MRLQGFNLAPVQKNTTWCSSTFNMVKRYLREGFEDAIRQIGNIRQTKQSQIDFLNLIPTEVTRDKRYAPSGVFTVKNYK